MRFVELLSEATFGVDLTQLSLASVCTVLTSFIGVPLMSVCGAKLCINITHVLCGHVNSYAGAILYYARRFTNVSSFSNVHVSTVLSEAEIDVTFCTDETPLCLTNLCSEVTLGSTLTPFC